MKRILYLFAAVSVFATIGSTAFPHHASAEASTKVQLSQTILPPSCYDTISTTGPTTDYISVWECEVQRPVTQ